MILDYDEAPEPDAVREYNDTCPPNAAWELAREYAHALGSDAAEQWGNNWYDLYKTEPRPHWRIYYGTMAKLLHDAAKEERAAERWLAGLNPESAVL